MKEKKSYQQKLWINHLNELNKDEKSKNCQMNYNYNKQLRDKHEDVKYDSENKKCGRGG